MSFTRGRWLAVQVVLLFPVLLAALLESLAFAFLAGSFLVCTFYLRSLDRMGFRHVFNGCLCCVVLSGWMGFVPGTREVQSLKKLQREFPVVRLDRRLAYESRHFKRRIEELGLSQNSFAAAGDAVALHANPLVRPIRDRMLVLVHSRSQEDEIRATGFGFHLRHWIIPGWLRLSPLRNIDFGERTPFSFNGNDYHAYWQVTSTSRSNPLATLHRLAVTDFLDPIAFGVAHRSAKQRVGFVEHAFHFGLLPESPFVLARQFEGIRLHRVELISTLRFERPVAYRLDHLPRMDQLRLAEKEQTRPLDSFEQKALEELWLHRNVVIQREGDNVRMVGAIRTQTICLQCHSVPEKFLLGAFSYELEIESSSPSGNSPP